MDYPVGTYDGINNRMGLTIIDMNCEPGGPKYNCQEPVGSTSDCLTLVPKETFQKSNLQEPVGSTSDRLVLMLNTIRHVWSK